MNLIFLTLLDISDVDERGIYHDLLRRFRDEGHQVYVIYSSERRKKRKTGIRVQGGITLLNVRTLNIQKTNIVEKGFGTVFLEFQYLQAFKRYLSHVHFDLVLYSTPPITLTRLIKYIKQRDGARSYLLLKDIFPQNAVDLEMMKPGSLLHRFFRKKERELYKVSDTIGCMSPANMAYVLKHNPGIAATKVEVNPNSIEPVAFEYSEQATWDTREKYGIPQDAVVFVYGGNLGKPQGVDFLLQVLASNKSNKRCFFLVVGSGTAFKYVTDWFNENEPANALVIAGLPKNEYDDLMKACDVGLLFLDKRFTIPNFPSRLLSYLEHKMPVLAATDRNTDIGRVIEMAGCGFYSLSGDLDTFNKNLQRLITTQSLVEMGEKGKQLLDREYTVQHSFEKIVNTVTAGPAN